MNESRDLNRLLDAWFAEGPVQVADRVIDDTASRIARQRQTPAWRLRSWRFPTMSTPIKLVAIGAALLAVLVGGAVFMGGGSAPPTPTPTPTRANPVADGAEGWPAGAGDLSRPAIRRQPLDVDGAPSRPDGQAFDDWAIVGPETAREHRNRAGSSPTRSACPRTRAVRKEHRPPRRWMTSSRQSRRAATGSCRSRPTSPSADIPGVASMSSCPQTLRACGSNETTS